MRLLLSLLGVIFLGLLAYIQWTNVQFIADQALPYSFLASRAAEAASLRRQGLVGTSVEQFVPLSCEQYFVAAVALRDAELHPGSDAMHIAEERIARLPASPDRLAAEARLALLEGKSQKALDRGIHADASAVVEQALDMLEAQKQFALEEVWDRRYISSLQHRATDREALAAALWRLARLENRSATTAATFAQQLAFQHRALEVLHRELRLTPFSGKVLLTAGYAALALHMPDEAQQHFMAAVQSDPASASGFVGLTRVAIMLHHTQDIRQYTAQAMRLGPQQSDVQNLHAELTRR